MQLNGEDLGLIPDNYRAEQLDFVNSVLIVTCTSSGISASICTGSTFRAV